MHRLDLVVVLVVLLVVFLAMYLRWPKAQLPTLEADAGLSHQSFEIELADPRLWRRQSHIRSCGAPTAMTFYLVRTLFVSSGSEAG